MEGVEVEGLNHVELLNDPRQKLVFVQQALYQQQSRRTLYVVTRTMHHIFFRGAYTSTGF